MENKTGLVHVSNLVFTTKEKLRGWVSVKFGDKEFSNFGSDDNVKIERDFFSMDETERKFIIMSRIAVALRRKGLHCSVTIQESNYCDLYAFLHTSDGECEVVEKVYSYSATEAELLDWWSAIENGVE